jgi:hypothetical protein
MNTEKDLADHFLEHCCSRLEVLSSWVDEQSQLWAIRCKQSHPPQEK